MRPQRSALPSFAQWIALVASLLTPTASLAVGEKTVWVSSLDLSTVEQGWGTPQADRSVDGHPLSIAGRKFEHGLGTHSPGSFLLDVHGSASRFTARAGIDDEVGARGSAVLTVTGDGKLLWSSGVMRGGEPSKPVDLDLHGIHRLALLIDDAGDGFEFDHVDWADARIDFTGAPPAPLKIVESTPEIAPPGTTGRAHLTSPSVVGVYTGSPVLINLTAAGEGPIRFSARKLPPGLSLNRSTGQITGGPLPAGTYEINVQARGPRGSESRPVRIVVGDRIALTPPLGWNSYDSYGDDVTEAEIRANAQALARDLHPHGWEYIVVDYRWYDPGASTAPNNPNARAGAVLSADAFGRLTPPANRFPSAADGEGFRSLAGAIHAMGLRFGIHIMRGIPRQAVKANTPIEGSPYHAAEAANPGSVCGWCPDMYGVAAGTPAGQAWYDSILRQYAGWGVDLIKVDDMSAPYSAGEIEEVRTAIRRCGRSIVLSLSPGETPIEKAAHVEAHANMWRISGDFWDDAGALYRQFDLISRWSGHAGPGHWPDADMIPLGHLSIHGRSVGGDRQTHLTRNEQLTLMSLWALTPSPLMLGMRLADDDAWTTALLSNDEVIAVNQDPLGAQARRLPSSGPGTVEVWIKPMQDGSRVVGFFNRSRLAAPASTAWADLGFTGTPRVRDLWRQRNLRVNHAHFGTEVPGHGAVLIRAWPG